MFPVARSGLVSMALGTLFSLGCLVSSTAAQEFQVGDRVLVKQGTREVPGIVRGKQGSHFYKVEHLDGPFKGREIPSPPQFMRLDGPGNSTPAGASGSKPAVNPFQPQAKPQFREWTDSTGQFKIEALLIKVEGDQVTIQRKDGENIVLPLAKLSAADQAYVRSQGGGAPAGFQVGDKLEVQWGSTWYKATIKETRGNEYKISYDGWSSSSDEWVGLDRMRRIGAPAPAGKQSPDGVPSAGDVATVTPNTSSVQRLAPGRAPSPAAFQPDAAPTATGSFNPIVLKGKSGRFFENPNCLSLVPERAQALIAYVNAPPGGLKTTRFEFCDLQTGRAVPGSEVGEELKTFGLSPDGTMLLTRSTKFGFGNSNRVDTWKVDGVNCERVKSWIPYERAKNTERNVDWAEWVDAGHFLTLSSGGTLILWDANAANAIYQMDLGGQRGVPALSANRKQLALASESGVEVLDALTGEVLVRVSPDRAYSARLAFRSDGGGLAMLTSGRLQLWDLPSGTKLDDVSVPGVSSSQRVDWVHDEYVLANGQYLVAVGRHCVVWDYGSGTAKPDASDFVGGRFWYVATEGDRQSLVPVQLPHPAAVAVAQGIQDRDFLVSPGKTIGLEVRVPVDVEPLKKIQAALKNKLEQSGFAVGSGGPIKLVARTEQGEQEKRSYRAFGRGGSEDVTVRSIINLLEFVVNGKSVWERRSVTSAPFMLQMEEGESIQQAVKRAMQPNATFFSNEWVPSFIPRPELAKNQSKLTISGVR